MKTEQTTGPLAGVKVIDITSVFMGPSATQMLADLGADVIKVEAPSGDSTRGIGPCGDEKLGPLFLGLNRNKRSIVLDLKAPGDGRPCFAWCAMLTCWPITCARRPSQRLGLDYETLSATNPRLVYVGMFGFSQRGRYAPQAAFDDLYPGRNRLATSRFAGQRRQSPISANHYRGSLSGTLCFRCDMCRPVFADHHRARDSVLMSPCSRPWCPMCWETIFMARPLFRRRPASAIRGCSRQSGARTGRRMDTSAA